MERSAVIAIGGNALILDGQRGTIAEQFANATETASHIAALIVDGWRVVITHGNGPQVGFILLRSDLIGDETGIPRLSLDMAVADSQGGIGHILGNALLNELGQRGMADRVACILTHVVVDADDPAFGDPTKPIGPAYSADEAEAKRQHEGWAMVEDSGRGYRRIVASPHPRRIVEAEQIKALVATGCVVIAAGGGGIPSSRKHRVATGAWRRSSTRTWPRRCWRPASASRCWCSRPASSGWPFISGSRTSASWIG